MLPNFIDKDTETERDKSAWKQAVTEITSRNNTWFGDHNNVYDID